LGFGVWALIAGGFEVASLGFGVRNLARLWGAGFGVWGLGLRLLV